MATTSAPPFPADGKRNLSTKEMFQRLSALKCTMPKDTRPSCSGQVFVGIFFDGTGNNMKLDYEQPAPDKRKHSNIVKSFRAYRDEPRGGYLRHYIPGVGTPFPEIGDANKYLFNKNRGSIAAEKGEDRIAWAFTRLLNSPHDFVFGAPLIPDGQAKTIVGNMASTTNPGAMRRVVLNTWQDKLKAALIDKKPRVEQINLSVFGFSRGAAQARVFVNWLFEVCKQEDGGWTFAGLPIRLQFLGIFDTVASVGLANLFDDGTLAGHQSWADNSMEIHPALEQCVHYVAGHEVRACFPLDSVRVKAKYPANALEVMYPGSHSDVGGGYAAGDWGISPEQDSFLCVIPGANMHHEARKAGVPLKPLSSLSKADSDALTPSENVIRDFNAYTKVAASGAAPVEDLLRKNMALYLSHRFKNRSTFFERAPFKTASTEHRTHLRKTQTCLIERMTTLGQGDPMDAKFDPVRAATAQEKAMQAAGKKMGTAERHLIDVCKRIDVNAVTPDAEQFFDRYVHDSMAGFIGFGMDEYATNKIGIVKFRTVFKGND
jgi:Uncharacterized alpha/beta hydrolase domain (DUF2235)